MSTRGTRDASQLTLNQDVSHQGQFNAAGEVLAEALKLDPTDPAIYHATLMIGRGMGLAKEQLRFVFDKGAATDKLYLPIYTEMALGLLPKTPTERGDIASFLDEIAATYPGDDGTCLVAKIVGELRKSGISGSELGALGVDMQKVDAGADILFARYPSSLPIMNLACWRACERGDRLRAAQLFTLIGTDIDESFWGDDQVFRRLRSWALEDEPANQERCILAGMSEIKALAFSADGAMLAAGGSCRWNGAPAAGDDLGRSDRQASTNFASSF
jgi:hypothetical protein